MAGPDDFSLESSVVDDVRVIAVHGDIDQPEGERLAAAIVVEVDLPVVVDLRACTFMGSEGLRALLIGRRHCAERGHRLVLLVDQHGPLPRVLNFIGGPTLFNVRYGDDLEGATGMAARLDRRTLPDRRLRPE